LLDLVTNPIPSGRKHAHSTKLASTTACAPPPGHMRDCRVLVLPTAMRHKNVDVDLTQYQIESPLKVIIVAVPPFLLPLIFLSPVASVSVVSIFPPSSIMVILVVAAIVIANARLLFFWSPSWRILTGNFEFKILLQGF
jgi:hypothetical protein